MAVDSVVVLVQDGAVQYAALTRAAAAGEDRWAQARRGDFGADVVPLVEALDRLDPRAFFARKLEVVLDGIAVLAPGAPN